MNITAMNKLLNVLIVLALVICSAAAVDARVITAPTADVLRDGRLNLGYSFHRGTNYLNASLGVFDNIEVGVTGVLDNNAHLRTNMQLAVLKETVSAPGVGVGVEIDDARVGLYGVVSKQLGSAGLRGHLAWGSGRYSRGMVGVTAVLNPVQVSSNGKQVPTVSAALEYDGRGLNTGIQAQFLPGLNTQLYLSDFQRIGFGVQYNIAF